MTALPKWHCWRAGCGWRGNKVHIHRGSAECPACGHWSAEENFGGIGWSEKYPAPPPKVESALQPKTSVELALRMGSGGEAASRARSLLQETTRRVESAIDGGDMKVARSEVAMGCYYLGILHATEGRLADPVGLPPEVDADIDDAKFFLVLNRVLRMS